MIYWVMRTPSDHLRQARLKYKLMDPNIKMLEEWTSAYVWKAIFNADSLVIIYLVVWTLVCIHSGVK